METQHTPGPWHWSHEYKNSLGEPTWSILDSTGFGVLSCDEPNSPQNVNQADAALIAAAPCLLEALRLVQQLGMRRDGRNRVLSAVDAAVAKAMNVPPNARNQPPADRAAG